MSGCASLSAPVAGSWQYPFSVTVAVTTRMRGSAKRATSAAASAPANSVSRSAPITRGVVPSPVRVSSV